MKPTRYAIVLHVFTVLCGSGFVCGFLPLIPSANAAAATAPAGLGNAPPTGSQTSKLTKIPQSKPKSQTDTLKSINETPRENPLRLGTANTKTVQRAGGKPAPTQQGDIKTTSGTLSTESESLEPFDDLAIVSTDLPSILDEFPDPSAGESISEPPPFDEFSAELSADPVKESADNDLLFDPGPVETRQAIDHDASTSNGLRKMTPPDVTPQNADPRADKIDSAATLSAPKSISRTNNLQHSPRVAANLDRQRGTIRDTTFDSPAREAVPEGTGVPGPKNIEGPQNAQLLLEKISPKEVQIEQPAVLKTVIKNVGRAVALDLTVRDQIPQGSRLISTNPSTQVLDNGEILWSLGSLAPGEETYVEMEVLPLREGEIGSVATAYFANEVSGKTMVTKAMLDVDMSAPGEVLIGENITYTITVSNPGSGTASGIKLEWHIPDGLVYEKGKNVIFTVGQLKPKESKQLPVVLQCVSPGKIVNQIKAIGDNNLESIAELSIDVLAPDLELKIAGPRQRYLERKAAYTLTVSNPGTAPANGVDLVAQLPAGLKFESTNQSGLYDEKTHTVHWSVEELPAQGSGDIELITIPVRSGEHSIRFSGADRDKLKAETNHSVSIQGLPALGFEVFCLSDPVEVGKNAVYEVKLTNRGTKASKNIGISIRLSEGMEFTSAEGPTKYRTQGGVIEFDSLGTLDAKQEKTFKFTANCVEVGDHRISVSMISDELTSPITKEESTQVFGDL